MTYPMALLLGFVQGVAEFLPISSSGHLTLMQHFFGVQQVDNLYNILLHFATLVTVFIVYRRDIAEMVLEFFRGLSLLCSGKSLREEARPPEARRLVLMVILGTLPLFLVLPVEKIVQGMGQSPVFVSLMLIVTGCILFFSDRLSHGTKGAHGITVKDALLVGLTQVFATFPGISRAGTTISAGMLRGFDRAFAVRYSFLLSLPAVLGATMIEVIKAVGEANIDLSLLPMYLSGMIVAGVVGYFSIRLVQLLADRGKFGKFAYYCWIAGAVALAASVVIR